MPINMEGDLVVLGFQTKVLLTKADAPSNLGGIAKAIYDVVGLAVKVRCVLNSNEAERRLTCRAIAWWQRRCVWVERLPNEE